MEWMGHRDLATTLVYADYAPDPAQGASFVKLAFGGASPTVDRTALASGRPVEQ